MQELFLEIYLFILCINGGIMVVDSITDTPLITPFDVQKHCFDTTTDLIIVHMVGPVITETYTDEATCTANSGLWAYQEIAGASIPLIGSSDHCEFNGQPNYRIEDSAECTTKGGTWNVSTGTLKNEVVSDVNAGPPILSPLTDAITFPLAVIQGLINFLTGGFIWQALSLIGLPSMFVFILQGIIGLLLIRTMVYYVLGR
jgi:hypothetical protein